VSATININYIVSPQDESNTVLAIGSLPNPISAQSLALLGSTQKGLPEKGSASQQETFQRQCHRALLQKRNRRVLTEGEGDI
jgi:hypothetical protein